MVSDLCSGEIRLFYGETVVCSTENWFFVTAVTLACSSEFFCVLRL